MLSDLPCSFGSIMFLFQPGSDGDKLHGIQKTIYQDTNVSQRVRTHPNIGLVLGDNQNSMLVLNKDE